jgi:hypothetical protein
MPESQQIDNTQRGISDESRGIKIPAKSQEVTDYKLLGYKLESKTIDLYPETSQRKVVTRLDEKPYSEVMPGVLSTEFHYQPKGEGPEIYEGDVGLMDKPIKSPPKPVERLSDQERGITEKGIEAPIVPPKKNHPKLKVPQIEYGKPTLIWRKKTPTGSTKEKTPAGTSPGESVVPNRRCVSLIEFETIDDLLFKAAALEIIPGLGKGLAQEYWSQALFFSARRGIISIPERKEIEEEETWDKMKWAIIDAVVMSIGLGKELLKPLELIESVAEKVKTIYEGFKAANTKREHLFRVIQLSNSIYLVPCIELPPTDKEWRGRNSLFGVVANKIEEQSRTDMGEVNANRGIVIEAVEKAEQLQKK